MELQPILRGELVFLRPLVPDDFDDLFAVASDSRIWTQHPAFDRYQINVFRSFFEEAINSQGAFAIIENEQGRLIGSSRFYKLDKILDEVFIGYTFLSTPYWGGRYNYELKHLMLSHAFKFITTVKFEVGENNLRSRKALLKIGAQIVRSGSSNTESLIYKISKTESMTLLGVKMKGATLL